MPKSKYCDKCIELEDMLAWVVEECIAALRGSISPVVAIEKIKMHVDGYLKAAIPIDHKYENGKIERRTFAEGVKA